MIGLASVITKYGFDDGHIAFLLVDASGGVDLKYLRSRLETLTSLAQPFDFKLFVIVFDDRIISSALLTPSNIADVSHLHLAGGGGTRPEVAIDFACLLHREKSTKARIYVYSDMLFSLRVADYAATCDFIWVVDKENSGNMLPELVGGRVII